VPRCEDNPHPAAPDDALDPIFIEEHFVFERQAIHMSLKA
jgi:hypothetical protein